MQGSGNGTPTPPEPTPTASNEVIFGAVDNPVEAGDSISLSWKLNGDITKVTITPSVDDVTGNSDKRISVSPDQTTTYTLRAENSARADTETLILQNYAPCTATAA